jgi:hypothetical protein
MIEMSQCDGVTSLVNKYYTTDFGPPLKGYREGVPHVTSLSILRGNTRSLLDLLVLSHLLKY